MLASKQVSLVVIIERPGWGRTFKVIFNSDDCGGPGHLTQQKIVDRNTGQYPAGYGLTLYRCRGALNSYGGTMPFSAFKQRVENGDLGVIEDGSVAVLPSFREKGHYSASSWDDLQQVINGPASSPTIESSGTRAMSAKSDGSPTEADILRVHAILGAGYNESRLTSTPGEEVYSSQIGDLYTVHRSISNLSCVKKRLTLYDCSYRLQRHATADGSGLAGLAGQMQVAFGGGENNTGDLDRMVEYDFVRTSSGWTSFKMNAELAVEAREADVKRQTPAVKDGCGMYRDYSDISSVAERYRYACHPGSTPDR